MWMASYTWPFLSSAPLDRKSFVFFSSLLPATRTDKLLGEIKGSDIHSLSQKRVAIARGRIRIFLNKELCASSKPLVSMQSQPTVVQHDSEKRELSLKFQRRVLAVDCRDRKMTSWGAEHTFV